MPKTLVERFRAKVRKTDGCWLWTGAKTTEANPYGVIRHLTVKRLAHRVAWELEHGPIPDGLHVCHRCDTPLCVRGDHLFLGTNAENTADKIRKGRGAVGEQTRRAKLSAEKVLLIRSELASGATQEEVAARLGMTQGQISKVHRGAAWRHVA